MKDLQSFLGEAISARRIAELKAKGKGASVEKKMKADNLESAGGSGGGGAFQNGDYLGVILTSGSYGIYDHGGFQMLRDPYSSATNGLVKVNGWIRSAGIVQRPQSIVQITY